jgi:hypothetical protein
VEVIFKDTVPYSNNATPMKMWYVIASVSLLFMSAIKYLHYSFKDSTSQTCVFSVNFFNKVPTTATWTVNN